LSETPMVQLPYELEMTLALIPTHDSEALLREVSYCN
jgi:hypothetical protein